MRRFWTPPEDEQIRQLYPGTSTKRIAEQLGRTLTMVYQRARILGLSKSAEYMASPDAYRLRRDNPRGVAFRFPKGHVPHNKGKRMPGWSRGRMRETQFPKGNRPQTWKPVGTEVVDRDGYLKRKIADDPNVASRHNWVFVHVEAWTKVHGPVPAGYAVVFKDGDKSNIAIGNLECISRQDLMRRNTVHNLPPELARVIQLNGALKRRIRRLSGKEQDVRSPGPSLRDARTAQG